MAAYEYDAFGQTLREAGPYAASNPFRFSTKYTDLETGLVYYGLRYYSPTMGRFINKDPTEEKGGLNLYAFCLNDGINHWDLNGQGVMDVLDGIDAYGAGSKPQVRVQGTDWGSEWRDAGDLGGISVFDSGLIRSSGQIGGANGITMTGSGGIIGLYMQNGHVDGYRTRDGNGNEQDHSIGSSNSGRPGGFAAPSSGFEVEAGPGTRGSANGSRLDGQIRVAGVIGSIQAVNQTQADPQHHEFAGEIYQINDPNKADLVGAFFGDSSVTIITGPTRGVSPTQSTVDPNRLDGMESYFVAGYHSHPANSLFFSGDSRRGTQDFAVPKAGFPLFMGTSTGNDNYRVRVALPNPNGTRIVDKVVFNGGFP